MKRLIKKIIDAAVNFLKWVWSECKDWRTLVLLAIVSLVLGSPVWIGFLLGFLFGWSWAFVVASVVWAFWMMPGAPFFALAVAITLAIKKFFQSKFAKKNRSNENGTKISQKNTDSDKI